MKQDEERIFVKMVKEVCSELNIKIEVLSYGWILQLSKDGKVRHIAGNRFDNNPEATGNIACDKYATYEVLKSQNIPVIKHTMVFNPSSMNDYIDDCGVFFTIANEFAKYGKLVIKPNRGSQGRGVTLCNTMKEVEIAIQHAFKSSISISILPYYDIETEYRTFYLNDKVYLIYGKNKPYVIGDGDSDLGKLVEKLNLPDKSVVRDNLNNLDLTMIPKKDEKVFISWKHNLSGGAIPEKLDPSSELYSEIENLALKTGKAMNINFATIDIIKTTNNELYVLEVNSGVCSSIYIEFFEDGYEIMKSIYKEALVNLFK